MNDRVNAAMQALPDGEAELTLVVRLSWEDIARLGQEAGRLASRMQRPVTLDEAVGHRLRSARATAAHAKPAGEQPPAAVSAGATGTAGLTGTGGAGASVSALSSRPAADPARPPAEQARQAIERINGTA
ncbi:MULTISPECIES: hypothetical protein [unclassified Streptomyces]|uniref:hypothetical protein n=1 Tax=unclassified Streptomyces TaxID=2593676 RepID=UPI0005A60ADF|nr:MULTISPECIES: hypothetical protein [unclassified Streptomyces]ODA72003.1 hypothetical protein APS67_003873 [Streptomyces sp. AVP053U2]